MRPDSEFDPVDGGKFAHFFDCNENSSCRESAEKYPVPVTRSGDAIARSSERWVTAEQYSECERVCLERDRKENRTMLDVLIKVGQKLRKATSYSEFYRACVEHLPSVSPMEYRFASVFALFEDSIRSQQYVLRGTSFPDCASQVNRTSYREFEEKIVSWVAFKNQAVHLVRPEDAAAQRELEARFGFDPFEGKLTQIRPLELLVVPIHRKPGGRKVSGVICLARVEPRARACRECCEIKLLQMIADIVIGPRMHEISTSEFSNLAIHNLRNLTTGQLQSHMETAEDVSTAIGACIKPFFGSTGFEEVAGPSRKVIYISYLVQDEEGKPCGYRPVSIFGNSDQPRDFHDLPREFRDEFMKAYPDGICPMENSLTKFTIDKFRFYRLKVEEDPVVFSRTTPVVSLNDLPLAVEMGKYRDILGDRVKCALSCVILKHGGSPTEDRPIGVLTILSDSFDLMPTQFVTPMRMVAELIGTVLEQAERSLLASRMSVYLHDAPRLLEVSNWVSDPDLFTKKFDLQGKEAVLYCDDILSLYPSVISAHQQMFQDAPLDMTRANFELTRGAVVQRVVERILRYVARKDPVELPYSEKWRRHIDYSPAARLDVLVHTPFFAVCLLNLLKNAWNASMDECGEIVHRIGVTIERDEDCCRLEVRNHCTETHWRLIESYFNPGLLLLDMNLRPRAGKGLLVMQLVTRLYQFKGRRAALSKNWCRETETVAITIRFPFQP